MRKNFNYKLVSPISWFTPFARVNSQFLTNSEVDSMEEEEVAVVVDKNTCYAFESDVDSSIRSYFDF